MSLTVTDTSSLTSTVATVATIDVTGPALGGTVSAGTQTGSGAHVYLFAENTSGYGQPSISLLDSLVTGHSDSVGAVVLTDAGGSFTVPAGFGGPVGSQLYFHTLGGTVGTATNSAIGLPATLGACNSPNAGIPVTINEVTTVATAYALAGFAIDATHVSSSGTALAQTGVASALTNAANLASTGTGTALAVTPVGEGNVVPQSNIDTLADRPSPPNQMTSTSRSSFPRGISEHTGRRPSPSTQPEMSG